MLDLTNSGSYCSSINEPRCRCNPNRENTSRPPEVTTHEATLFAGDVPVEKTITVTVEAETVQAEAALDRLNRKAKRLNKTLRAAYRQIKELAALLPEEAKQ